MRYGTGDEEKTIAGRITAGVGQFAVHAEGARRAAEDYDVPDAYGSDKLRDSFAESTSYAVGASWVTSKGYIGAAYSRLESDYGLPGHSHRNAVCHTHGLDPHCAAHGGFDDPFGGPDDHTASIKPRSERADVRADYDDLLPGIAHTRLRLSYTDYAQDDVEYYHTFEQDKVASYETRTPGYNMLNATLSFRFDLGQAKAVELYVRGTNLLNELAFAHTSFVKDQSPLRGRSVAIGTRHSF